MDISKTTLLKMADAFLAEARKLRKESASQPNAAKRAELMGEAQQLEAKAARLETDAASAKDGVFVQATTRP
ncbi:MAG: hypothetical protein ACM3II_16770 [Rhodospirillaceae bacterium]